MDEHSPSTAVYRFAGGCLGGVAGLCAGAVLGFFVVIGIFRLTHDSPPPPQQIQNLTQLEEGIKAVMDVVLLIVIALFAGVVTGVCGAVVGGIIGASFAIRSRNQHTATVRRESL
jgi:hypothetical protein